MKIARILEMSHDPQQAMSLQEKYAQEVITYRIASFKPQLIAGADVSYGNAGEKAYVAIVVIELASGDIVEQTTWVGDPEFPYRPGLLALREAPCLLKGFAQLQNSPDVVLVDGNGILHPRRFGLACHIGLCLDVSAIGCAKSLLFGKHKPLCRQGDTADICHNGENLGVAMLAQAKQDPIYISVGHKIDIASALALVKRVVGDTGDPAPLIYAHNLAKQLYHEDPAHVAKTEQKQQNRQRIIDMAGDLRKQGLSYSAIAVELNKNSEIKKMSGHKLTPRKIRNWLELQESEDCAS